MMESTGHSYTDGKLPSSSYSTMFSHPSPPPSAHSSVDIQNQNWSLPQSPQQQQQGDPSSTPAPPESSSSGLSLPPISALYNIAPPGTTTAFSPGLSALPPHLRMGSDNASIETWITPANTAELAGDDDDFDDTNYVYENGRRYHANMEGRILYPLPNDESEQERQDMIHKLALWMMHEKLFYAPIEDTLRQHGGMVFDLGTGTGEWAMEMAQKYGKSQVYGVDLSPIQPAYVWDNVFFSTGDFDDESTWADFTENSFDYIHIRFTTYCIKDPVVLLQRAMKYLKPGGYVEFQELYYWPQCDDNSLNPSTPYAFRDFCYYMQLGLSSLGLEQFLINRVPDLLRSHGFDDVTEVRHKLPIGRWARDRKQREKGIWFLRMVLMEGLSGICKRPFMQGLGWKDSQVEMFLVDVRKSLNDSAVHAYFPFTVVYGRKPLVAGGEAAATSTKA